jgi:hypothetical protein
LRRDRVPNVLPSVVLRHNESSKDRHAIPMKTGEPVVPIYDPVMGGVSDNEKRHS